MTESILRQRRNLIITSALLWAMKYGGVTFTKISLAGFDISFQKPEALILSLWIAFGYFLYRYYQYFSHEGVSKLEEVYIESREIQCAPIIRALIKEKCPDNIDDGALYSYNLLKKNDWIYGGLRRIKGTDSSGVSSISEENFNLQIQRKKLRRGITFAIIDTIFRNSVVTDYLFPFILAGGVLLYCGSNNWAGSFLKLIF